MALDLVTTTVEDVTVVDCQGQLVAGSAETLRHRVGALLGQACDVVLDLSGITYIDSAGIGLLARLVTTAVVGGGCIRLARLSERAREVLRLTRLITIFEVYDTAERAVQASVKARRGAKSQRQGA